MKKYITILAVLVMVFTSCEKDNMRKYRVLHGVIIAEPSGGLVAFREDNTGFETTRVHTNGIVVKHHDRVVVEEEKNLIDGKRVIYRISGLE